MNLKNLFKKQKNKGIALLIAVIATSALLLASVAISDIAYKQQLISYAGRESKEAFYAADAGLECALYHDLKIENFFPVPGGSLSTAGNINCNNNTITANFPTVTSQIVVSEFSYNISGSCVIVAVQKSTGSGGNIDTNVVSRGYNTTCSGGIPNSGARNVERALEANY